MLRWDSHKSLRKDYSEVPKNCVDLGHHVRQYWMDASGCIFFFLIHIGIVVLNFFFLFQKKQISTFFFIINYLFLAVLGLRFCARAFSSCGKRGLFIVMRGPLTIAASLVAEHRLQTRRLSSCGSRA